MNINLRHLSVDEIMEKWKTAKTEFEVFWFEWDHRRSIVNSIEAELIERMAEEKGISIPGDCIMRFEDGRRKIRVYENTKRSAFLFRQFSTNGRRLLKTEDILRHEDVQYLEKIEGGKK